MIGSNDILKWMLFVGCLALHTFGFSQIKIRQFEEIASLQQNDEKNLIVFVYTDWCSYCGAMQKTTFGNTKVIKQINKDFYFIQLNAEEKRSIYFDNTTFKFKPTGKNTGIHELAEALATVDKKVSYPVLIVLNAKNEVIYQYAGFLKADQVFELLNGIIRLQKEALQTK